MNEIDTDTGSLARSLSTTSHDGIGMMMEKERHREDFLSKTESL